jgi:RNA polymerase-binding transcription factor DksA
MTDYTTHQATLTEQQRQLQTDLAAIATRNSETNDWEAIPESLTGEADENIVADSSEAWQERRATVAALEMRLRNVERALAKLAAGTYGVCELSGELIEPERLAANPAARTCAAHREREAELPF